MGLFWVLLKHLMLFPWEQIGIFPHLREFRVDESVGEGRLADPAVADQDDVAVEPLLHRTSHDHIWAVPTKTHFGLEEGRKSLCCGVTPLALPAANGLELDCDD